MLVFSTQLCELLPSNLSGSPPPPFPKSKYNMYIDPSVWLGGGGAGAELCWRDFVEAVRLRRKLYKGTFHEKKRTELLSSGMMAFWILPACATARVPGSVCNVQYGKADKAQTYKYDIDPPL